MISYEVYKIIHLSSLALAFSGLGINLFAKSNNRLFKILGGVCALLIFVSGMGLLARIGVKHAEPWDLWIRLKVLIWAFIAIGAPVVAKRIPKFSQQYYWFCIVLFTVAVGLVNYKP